MEVIETAIEGLFVIDHKVFGDERGYFFESYNKLDFEKNGISTTFVQDNQSKSAKGIVRGLHLQQEPYEQVKLISVASGSILDVAVDVRVGSKTYGKYYPQILSEENKKMFYIPAGFAHGFLSLEDNTIVQYKCSNVYSKEHELGIMWNDKDINIDWGIDYEPIISDKDKQNMDFKSF